MYKYQGQEHCYRAEDLELADFSEESDLEQNFDPSRVGHLFRRSLLVAAAIGIVALAAVHTNHKMLNTSAKAFQEKVDDNGFLPSPSPAPPAPGTASGLSSFYGASPAPAGSESASVASVAAGSQSITAPATAAESQEAASVTTQPLRPQENLNDGNKCADDEESLGELCYQKCSILTNSEAPVRISAFGCAKSRNFGDVIGEKIAGLIPCQGYDVAGKAEGNGCPHAHGACLTDEEFSLGKCYKQCAILTNNEYIHRTSMTTCCKENSFLECLNPMNFKMDTKFAVGGGEAAHKGIHDPIKSVTEA